MKKILLYTTIFSLTFLGAITVNAEDEVPVPVLYDEGTPVPDLIEEPVLEDVGRGETPDPSNLGLWWTSVKENFVLTFTFNPEKRVERALAFAERRMEMAETFAQNAVSEEDQDRVVQMIEKAESFMDKAEEKKLEVEEKTKERLEEQKDRLEEQKQKVQEYNDEKLELIERIKDGDEGAKQELTDLNNGRREEAELLKLENEARRTDQDENIEAKKLELQNKADGGDERAQRALEALEQAEMRLTQQRLDEEAKRMEMEQNRLELLKQAQERREEMLVGGDKDEHGCIPSAGYTWCESKEECLRPWEDGWDDSCLVGIEDKNDCLEYRYSTCPDYCEKVCVSSFCSEIDEDGGIICTDDCGGLNSCIGGGEKPANRVMLVPNTLKPQPLNNMIKTQVEKVKGFLNTNQ